MLDSLIDYEQDVHTTGQPGFIRYYPDTDPLRQRLPEVAQAAVALAGRIPDGAHHLMTLIGAVAFHTSAPSARSAIAQPICTAIQRQLRPLIWPTMAVMHGWRLANRIHDRRRGIPRGQAGGGRDPQAPPSDTFAQYRTPAVPGRVRATR